MKCDKKDLLLYGVTDRSWLGERTLYSAVEQSILGGVTMVQQGELYGVMDNDGNMVADCQYYAARHLYKTLSMVNILPFSQRMHRGCTVPSASTSRLTET